MEIINVVSLTGSHKFNCRTWQEESLRTLLREGTHGFHCPCNDIRISEEKLH